MVFWLAVREVLLQSIKLQKYLIQLLRRSIVKPFWNPGRSSESKQSKRKMLWRLRMVGKKMWKWQTRLMSLLLKQKMQMVFLLVNPKQQLLTAWMETCTLNWKIECLKHIIPFFFCETLFKEVSKKLSSIPFNAIFLDFLFRLFLKNGSMKFSLFGFILCLDNMSLVNFCTDFNSKQYTNLPHVETWLKRMSM